MVLPEGNVPKRSPRRPVGPKGQVVIPKEYRDYLGIEPGSEVEFMVRDKEIVLQKAEDPQAYLDRFFSIVNPKLKEKLDVDKIYDEQPEEEHGISRRKRVRIRRHR